MVLLITSFQLVKGKAATRFPGGSVRRPKFSNALPRHIAEATLAQFLADLKGVRIPRSASPRRLLD